MKKRLVVLSGAGISAESGIRTFRDSGGLWEGHDIMEVASPQGWARGPQNVLEFYNQRRKDVRAAQPNAAHRFIHTLEKTYQVSVVTQNVDDLHERAGSTNILHLHGEILKARSTTDENEIIHLGKKDIHWGDKSANGAQLRPHIVWFGEQVPKMEEAIQLVSRADILIIIGTSLQVYPAAGLYDYAPAQAQIILVDPKAEQLSMSSKVNVLAYTAVESVPHLRELLV